MDSALAYHALTGPVDPATTNYQAIVGVHQTALQNLLCVEAGSTGPVRA